MLEKTIEITLNHYFLVVFAGITAAVGLYPALEVMFPSFTNVDPLGIVAGAIIGMAACFLIAIDAGKMCRQAKIEE